MALEAYVRRNLQFNDLELLNATNYGSPALPDIDLATEIPLGELLLDDQRLWAKISVLKDRKMKVCGVCKLQCSVCPIELVTRAIGCLELELETRLRHRHGYFEGQVEYRKGLVAVIAKDAVSPSMSFLPQREILDAIFEGTDAVGLIPENCRR